MTAFGDAVLGAVRATGPEVGGWLVLSVVFGFGTGVTAVARARTRARRR